MKLKDFTVLLVLIKTSVVCQLVWRLNRCFPHDFISRASSYFTCLHFFSATVSSNSPSIDRVVCIPPVRLANSPFCLFHPDRVGTMRRQKNKGGKKKKKKKRKKSITAPSERGQSSTGSLTNGRGGRTLELRGREKGGWREMMEITFAGIDPVSVR